MIPPSPFRRARDPLPRSERGSAMLAALCFAIVFTISLASFIAVTYTSARLSTRNLMRAHASEVAEAGLELALYAINNESGWPGWTTSPASGGTATATLTMAWDPSSHVPQGLVLTSSNPTPMDFGNGVNAQVTVTVTGTGGTSPLFTSSAMFTVPNELPVYRKLTATSGPAPVFVNALSATTGNITFASAGTVDSFLSASANGYAYATPGFSAVVASGNNAAGTTISLANANISGFATGFDSASPTSTNWLSYAGSGKVIGAASGSTFIDSTRLLTNPVPYQPLISDVPEPATAILNGPMIIVGTATKTLGSVLGIPEIDDIAGDLTIAGLAQVTVLGPTILYVHGNFNLNPLGTDLGLLLFTNPLGTNHPSLEVHMLGTGGPSSGNVTINGGAILGNFPLYLSPLLTVIPGSAPRAQWMTIVGPNDSGGAVTVGNNSPLYATLYFPKAPVTVNGSPTIYGSIVGSSISITGSPIIHYDTSLRTPTSFVYDAAFHAFQTTYVLGAIADSPGP